jgi:hypothetical protein
LAGVDHLHRPHPANLRSWHVGLADFLGQVVKTVQNPILRTSVHLWQT